MSGACFFDRLTARFRHMRLRTLLLFLFSSLILASVAATAYISHKSGQAAVDALVQKLEAETLESIFQHLDNYLGVPASINQSNLASARTGNLNLSDVENTTRFFWHQGQVFKGIGTIAYANAQGELVGANQPENYIVVASRLKTGGSIRRYVPGPGGEITSTVLADKPGYDARTRSWYKTAVQAGKPVWADISLSVAVAARLDLTAAAPYYDREDRLLGVFFVDLALNQINRFLNGLEVARHGKIFIADRDGLLVGVSHEEPFHRNGTGAGPSVERLMAGASPDPVIAAAAAHVEQNLGGFAAVSATHETILSINGARQVLTIAPYRNGEGLNWVVVLAMPEKSVMGPIEENMKSMMLLGAAALLGAVIFAAGIAYWVTHPLLSLNVAAKALAQGKWGEPLKTWRLDEVGELTHSFNDMAAQLKGTMDSLSDEIENRERQARILAESERKNRALLRALPDLMFVNRRDGVFLDYRSKEPLQLLAAPENFLGKTPMDFFPHDVARTFMEMIERTLSTGEMQVYEYPVTMDGEEKFYEARMVASGPKETLTICRDITDRKQAEKEREHLEERLRQSQKMEAIGTLAGGIAHDFNNLLQVMSGRLELLKRSQMKPEIFADSLQVIDQAAARAAELVRGLLTFAHKVDRSRGEVNLNDEVQFTLHMLERTIPKMITLEADLAKDLRLVSADSTQVEQILLNLAANARDAMPEGGKLTFRTRNTKLGAEFRSNHPEAVEGLYVKITVADTGTGMDEATSRRIFEPFFTTKEVGKGTGLGLSMVYGIVRDHDGYIDWETAPDTGTAFHIYLPALANSIVAGRVEAEAKADVTAGSGTLLVVDDEADIREVLKEGLEGLGYKVLLAASGEECLDIYRREGAPVDLIVLDLGMPGMGGRACFAELKKINPAARVLVASGYGASVAGQIASSAAGFLAKPYRLADIVKKIKELLGH